MSTLDEIKQQWSCSFTEPTPVSKDTMKRIIQSSVNKHLSASMQYFWASFTCQLIAYAWLSHLIIRHWQDGHIFLLSISGILLYLPFTIVLLKKFKKLAVAKAKGNDTSSVFQFILYQQHVLQSFFDFKKKYEWVLIPVSAGLGVYLTFTLYFPRGIVAFTPAVILTYLAALLACYLAIRRENKKGFTEPLSKLNQLLKEYDQ